MTGLVIALWAGRFVAPLDAGEESESDRGAQVGLGKRRNVACGYGRRRRLTADSWLAARGGAAGRRLVGCRPRLAAGRSPIGQNQRVILRSPSSLALLEGGLRDEGLLSVTSHRLGTPGPSLRSG